jgi:hypothetical protein
VRFLSSIKEDLQPGQHVAQGYISVWRILIFITGALIINMCRGIDAKSFFSPKFSEKYWINLIPTENISQHHFFFNYSIITPQGENYSLEAFNAPIFYILAIQTVCVLIMYQSCKYLLNS